MRIVFTVFAASTHFYNLVPMAWALRAAGHEVCVASQPDLLDTITRSGLTAVPVGEALNLAERSREVQRRPADQRVYGSGYDIAETEQGKLTWEYVHTVFSRYSSVALDLLAAESTVDDLVRFLLAWRADLVIWDAMTYAGPIAARATGVPHVRMAFAMDHLARMRAIFLDLAARRPGECHDPLAEWLDGKLARYGRDFDEDIVTGMATIDPMPACLRVRLDLNRLPVRPLPYNGPSTIPEWVLPPPKRPRVCLTLGQTGRDIRDNGVSAPDLVEAVADLDVDVVATLNSGQLAAIPTLPGNVRAVDFVPLNELLPSCSAIIHHGGPGTVVNAVMHGVPQLIVPAKLWGERVTARVLANEGVCLSIDPEDLTGQTLREQLPRLLDDPSFRDAAARLRHETRAAPTPAELVPELESLATHHRTKES